MGTANPALWEYRIWPEASVAIEQRLRAALDFAAEPPRTDIYFRVPSRAPAQAKLRGGAQFGIKELLTRDGGLEHWRPVVSSRFPLDDEDRATLARLFPTIPTALTSLAALREALLAEGDEVVVDKRRHIATDAGGLRAEIAKASLGGQQYSTLCLEHENPAELTRQVDRFGFGDWSNVSYPDWITRNA